MGGFAPIAIVGRGAVLPGAASIAEFWTAIREGRSFVRDVPAGRWVCDAARVLSPAGEPDSAYHTRGCYVEGFQLDPVGLNVSRALLAELDPLYHFTLAAGRDAWREAQTTGLDPARVGTILAAIALPTDGSSAFSREFFEAEMADRLGVQRSSAHASAWNTRVTALPATLLARALGLAGGAYTLDAACASSLYAIKLACDELSAGAADAMVVGGVSRPECLYTQIGFTQLKALSPSGRCRPYDAAADGLLVGEGAVVFVLKRLEDALRDGDRVYGVIRSVGLSNDLAGSLLAADSEGQLRAMRAAYAAAGWSPGDVQHVEGHGTGTPLGDGVELRSLQTLWREAGIGPTAGCVVGSVKSNVGHLLTGAGAAGILKTLLAFEACLLPPTAGFESPAAELNSAGFRVLSRAAEWPQPGDGAPRRAAVSAFGFGGINAHLLLEEHGGHTARPRACAPGKSDASLDIAIVGIAVQAAEFDVVEVAVGRFRLPPAEIPQTLPQQLLALNIVAEALDDAGLAERVPRPDAGAFVGISVDPNTSNFHHRWALPKAARRWADSLALDPSDDEFGEWLTELQAAAGPALNAPRVLGALGSIAASRVAREFGFGGPSFSVSAEEASGNRALEIACRLLAAGELNVAVAAAVDLACDERSARAHGKLQPGFAGARADAGVALTLKRLADARAARDRVYAVVRNFTLERPGSPQAETYAGAATGLLEVAAAALRLHRAESVSQSSVRVQAATLHGPAHGVELRAADRADGTQGLSRTTAPSRHAGPVVRVPTRYRIGDVRVPAAAERFAPVCAEVGDMRGGALAVAVAECGASTARAHQAYLKFSQAATESLGAALHLQSLLVGRQDVDHEQRRANWAVEQRRSGTDRLFTGECAFSREMCLEFARGSAARVLGPEFAEVDAFPARVRLPDEPLMLVDRIVSIAGVKRSLSRGTIVTQHDVREGAWYLDGGRMPVSLSIEAGQADLFLCAYLGIDLAVRGARLYRLLDATVRFYRDLPAPGETITYDIRIDRFIRQGDTYLFFFGFEGRIAGEPLLSMTGGCAGFFTEAEIAGSGGVIETLEESQPPRRSLPEGWRALAPFDENEQYDEGQIAALRAGDVAGCFGPAFDNLLLRTPATLPGGRLELVHRVTALEPRGGRYGLGLIRAEADIHPDDWFLTCHFVDDMVMPGTLMYECCVQTLRIFLMRMGWLAEAGDLHYAPLEGVASSLRCRGPVTPATNVVAYEVHIKELGYGPDAYAIADALMFADGEKIVRFADMTVRLVGPTREQLESLWLEPGETKPVAPIGEVSVPPAAAPAVFDQDRILACAIGKPSEAFGELYKPFDAERRMARLPAPPYSLLTRITRVTAAPWKLDASGWVEAQYDVPPDAWYFAANRQGHMPFAMLLEVALQTCGWFAAYKGSALRSDVALSFRNLGGRAVLHAEVGADAGTLTSRARLTRVSEAAGMIIEDFEFQVWRRGRCVYEGNTNFGFFTAEALANQVGLRDAAGRYAPSAADERRSVRFDWPVIAPMTPEAAASISHVEYGLPAKAWRMVDEVDCMLPEGGPQGLGYARAVKRVDPREWFFAAHFYQDPVWPGSLGIEAFLQLLKVVAMQRWGHDASRPCRFTSGLLDAAHTWTYRGQVVPTSGRVEVEALVTGVDDAKQTLRADGYLSVDGLCIYAMKDFGMTMLPEG